MRLVNDAAPRKPDSNRAVSLPPGVPLLEKLSPGVGRWRAVRGPVYDKKGPECDKNNFTLVRHLSFNSAGRGVQAARRKLSTEICTPVAGGGLQLRATFAGHLPANHHTWRDCAALATTRSCESHLRKVLEFKDHLGEIGNVPNSMRLNPAID